MTLPVVALVGMIALMLAALQPLVAIAAVIPLNWTIPLPCVEPKFAPAIVTVVFPGPPVGVKLVIEGAATTENANGLLATAAFTVTFTLPLTPDGTVAVTLESVQGGVIAALIVPNLTVLVP
jgi:hypothetical protein